MSAVDGTMDLMSTYHQQRGIDDLGAIDVNLISRRTMSQWREWFFVKNTKRIRRLLYTDLSKYVAGSDVSAMKLTTLNEFVPSFLKKITQVYNNPIHFTYDGVNKDEKKKFQELIHEDILFKRYINKNNRRTRLHGTNLVYVRYNERFDDIYINHLHEGNCWVVPYPDYSKKPLVVMYMREVNDEKRYYVWHRERKEHYYVKDEKPTIEKNGTVIVEGKKEPIGNNKTIEGPDYFPFIAYRYDDDYNKFWCNGMDGIIELARTLNTLLTVTGDDSIQESLKLLILNFNPGEEGHSKDEDAGMIKTGMRHPFFPHKKQNSIDKSDLNGKVVQGELYTNEILNFIDNVTGIVCSLHNIDNLFTDDRMDRVYAEALRLKYSFLEKDWREDVDLLKRYDKEFLKTLIKVNNYHRRNNKIDEDIIDKISMEYEKPKFTFDEQKEYQIEKQKWSDGMSNPVKWYAKKNGISEELAKKEIEENKQITEELIGTRTTLGMNATQANTEI